ncbi:MAG: TMEM175 family protein [Desulfobacteraceae bacterium]|jgi:uncharacterized membrane protein
MVHKTSGAAGKLTLDRLMAFSDGVIAIAITILVLGIDIPEDHSFSEKGLIGFLVRMGHDVAIYAVSFVAIATFWLQHHALFLYLRYCNRTLIWLNTLFLFSLTLIPFLSKLKFTYEQEPEIVRLFCAGVFFCGLTLLAMWRYVLSHSELLVRPTMDQAVTRSMTQRILLAPVVAVIAFCLSFVDVRLGTHAFFLIPLGALRHRLVDSGWEKSEPLR